MKAGSTSAVAGRALIPHNNSKRCWHDLLGELDL